MARSVSAGRLVSMTRGNHRLAVIDVRDEDRSYQTHIAGSHHFASGCRSWRGPPAERTPSSSTARSARCEVRPALGCSRTIYRSPRMIQR